MQPTPRPVHELNRDTLLRAYQRWLDLREGVAMTAAEYAGYLLTYYPDPLADSVDPGSDAVRALLEAAKAPPRPADGPPGLYQPPLPF